MSVPGFFSNVPQRLPHPRVDDWVVLVLHNALIHAFDLLRTNPPTGFVLATAKEDDITRQIEHIMENRLRKTEEVPGFNKLNFGKITKANELTNYNGSHPSKKPDLVCDLRRESLIDIWSTHDALFIECKPVDRTHKIDTKYCCDGISRFIDGDYAWAMQEGIMVAYVRDGHTISHDLMPVLTYGPIHLNLGAPPTVSPIAASSPLPLAEALHVSLHQRPFNWAGGQGKACAIRIFHSWHTCM